MNKNEWEAMSYAISKQLPNIHGISTYYGELSLDEEMKEAIKKTLEPILEKRMSSNLTN